jgi:DNA polymerase-1
MATLLLVDGTALAYRAYYAFIRNPLVNSKGENTSASYGFTSMLLGMMRQHQPDYLAVGFDLQAPTFRHEKFEAYKAQRPAMPEDLRPQIPRIKEILRAMNLSVLEREGFEADDILAGLAKQAEAKGWATLIATGDKDFLQIVNRRIKVVRPRTGKSEETIYGPEEVEKEYGVGPERIVDIFALAGDAVDNVPGVPGIGPKTAAELIRKFGSFEKLYGNLDKVEKPRIRKLLEEHREQAELSRELVTLHVAELPGLKLADLKVHEPDRGELMRLFKELEFESLYREYSLIKARKLESHRVADASEAELLASKVKKDDRLRFELEIGGSEISRMGVYADGKPWVVEKAQAGKLRPLFEDQALAKVGHDLKTAIKALAAARTEVRGPLFDTMLASYLLDPSWRGHQSLEALAAEHLGLSLAPPDDQGKRQSEMNFAPDPKQGLELLARRVDAIAALEEKFLVRLKEMKLDKLFYEIEMPLVPVLAGMERAGVLLDVGFFESMSKDLKRQIEKLEKEIYRAAGEEFNINSPKQLGVILFEKLKVGRARKTKTGYSTDVDVLTRLAGAHPLPKLVLDYRQLFKLKSTYIDALPAQADPKSHRLHTTFNQAVTETGRLSSSDPNLQNIPMREGLGREIRKGFIAEKGFTLLSADYSQIELRLVAHLSGDQALKKAFATGRDIHTETACAVFGTSPDKVTPDMRRQAKAINFGIVYGMGPYGLAQQLDIGPDEASLFINNYFNNFPQVQAWIALTVEQARRDGFVCTMLGRRRQLPEINSQNGQRRAFAERTAVNTPIQGTAADMIKLAMVGIARRFEEAKLRSRMLLQVHDELLFEVREEEMLKIKGIVKEEMEGAVKLSVPVAVEMGQGENWFEAH